MPSEGQPHGDGDRYPWSEQLKGDIGEDPARFLDQPLLEHRSGFSNPGEFVRARIRGITDISTLRAWRAIERRLGRDDGEPRSKVLAWLDEREEELAERDESQPRERRDRDLTWYARTPDGERVEWSEWEDRRRSPLADLGNNADAVATDGGDRDG